MSSLSSVFCEVLREGEVDPLETEKIAFAALKGILEQCPNISFYVGSGDHHLEDTVLEEVLIGSLFSFNLRFQEYPEDLQLYQHGSLDSELSKFLKHIFTMPVENLMDFFDGSKERFPMVRAVLSEFMDSSVGEPNLERDSKLGFKRLEPKIKGIPVEVYKESLALYREGYKLKAVKRIKDATGWNFQKSKNFVDLVFQRKK
jgi:hypothetical protein